PEKSNSSACFFCCSNCCGVNAIGFLLFHPNSSQRHKVHEEKFNRRQQRKQRTEDLNFYSVPSVASCSCSLHSKFLTCALLMEYKKFSGSLLFNFNFPTTCTGPRV